MSWFKSSKFSFFSVRNHSICSYNTLSHATLSISGAVIGLAFFGFIGSGIGFFLGGMLDCAIYLMRLKFCPAISNDNDVKHHKFFADHVSGRNKNRFYNNNINQPDKKKISDSEQLDQDVGETEKMQEEYEYNDEGQVQNEQEVCSYTYK